MDAGFEGRLDDLGALDPTKSLGRRFTQRGERPYFSAKGETLGKKQQLLACGVILTDLGIYVIRKRFKCCGFGGFTVSTFYNIEEVKDLTSAKQYQSLYIHMNNHDDLFLSFEKVESKAVPVARKKLTKLDSLDSKDLDTVFEPTKLEKTRSKTLIPTSHDFLQQNNSSLQMDTNRIDFIIDRFTRVYYLRKNRILSNYEFSGTEKSQLYTMGSSLKLKKKQSVLLGSKTLLSLRRNTSILPEDDTVPTEYESYTVRILYSRPYRRGDNSQFSIDKLAVSSNLGSSLFGVDYLCKDLRGGSPCIKKKCSITYLKEAFNLKPEEMAESFMINMDLSDYFPHIYQIRLSLSELEVYQSYFECGSLQRLASLQPNGCFEEWKTRKLAAVIAEGIETMHMLDVKLGILSTRTFCISRQGELFFDTVWFLSRHISTFKPNMISTIDLQYVAPEVIDSGRFSKSGDWWTLGAIIFEMVFGFTPYYSQNSTKMQANKKSQLNWSKLPRLVCTSALKNLLSKLLCPLPQDRLGWKEGVAEVLAHPWFASNQEDSASDLIQRRVVCTLEETDQLLALNGWENAKIAEEAFLETDKHFL